MSVRRPLRTRTEMSPRRWLLLAVVLTSALLLLDLARPTWTTPLRAAVAAAVAPAQSVLAGWDAGRLAEVTRQRDALAVRVAALENQLAGREALEALQGSASWSDQRLLPGRVVGFAAPGTPVAGRTVTIDVGADHGVAADRAVVSGEGLVGRVLRVAPGSSDVLLLGDAGVVVGVRFGAEGALGSVDAAPAPGLPPRGPDELTLTALGDSTIAVGDEVRTLGSPDSVPYAAGIPVGTVTAVDPAAGRLGRTAVVQPHVDPDTLDLVAVLAVEDR